MNVDQADDPPCGQPESILILYKLRKPALHPDHLVARATALGITIAQHHIHGTTNVFHGSLRLDPSGGFANVALATKPGIGTIMSLRVPGPLPAFATSALREEAELWFDTRWSNGEN